MPYRAGPWSDLDCRPTVFTGGVQVKDPQGLPGAAMHRRAFISAASALCLIGTLAAYGTPATAAQASSSVGAAGRALLFSSDGMRPDLMEKYAAAGAMPT
jgi:hypothetical protein